MFKDVGSKVKGAFIKAAIKLLPKKDKLCQMFFSTMSSNIKDIVILPASTSVAKILFSRMKNPKKHGVTHSGTINGTPVTLIRTHVGTAAIAPIMETLKELGPKAVIRLDYAGSMIESMKVGSLFIAEDAIPGDGTTTQYIAENKEFARTIFHEWELELENRDRDPVYYWMIANGFYGAVSCDGKLLEILKSVASKDNITCGTVWTTDGLFVESKEKVALWKELEAIGVDMETSGLYFLGKLFKIPTIAIHGISDNLMTQKPFYEMESYDPAIEAGIKHACDLLEKMLPRI
ncbi:MAG: hypothetical protein ACFFCS_05495 [Candidatus Hodarchaeota archaeon]